MKKFLFTKNTVFISIGSFILSLGINMFLTPNKISSGGVSSIGTILLHLFNIKMSVTNIAINLVLFFIGYKYLGKESVIKTIIGIIFLTLFLEITSFFPIYNDDIMLATIIGGVFIGAGTGLVVRRSGSTGGSDFLALVIKRFMPYISLANIILVIDALVIIISGVVFKSVTVTIYSIISMYISSRVTDAVVTLGNKAKAVQIFSQKSEEIANYVINQFERGITGIHCKGMYSHKEKTMLLCVVSPKELPMLVGAIKAIDKRAFVIINDAKEVLGEGFKSYADYNEINIKEKSSKNN